MRVYLINGKGYFDTGAEQVENGVLSVDIVPKKTCDMVVGGKTVKATNGHAEIPSKYVKAGINAVHVDGVRCEMLVRSGDTVTPMGFSARDLVKVAYDVDRLHKRLDELDAWKKDQTVDLFI